MYTIKETKYSKKEATIFADKIEEGIDFICRGGCDGVYLRSGDTPNKKRNSIDFSKFAKIPELKSLSISDNIIIKKDDNWEGIYNLKSLVSFGATQEKLDIDLAHFPQLEALFIKYSEKIINLNALTNLKHLSIWSLKQKDCFFFEQIKHLEELFIIQSEIRSIKGLEKLDKLRILELSNNNKLNDISILNQIENIEKVSIKKCKLLSDLNTLAENKSIKFLYSEKIDELNFIPSMKSLNYLGFAELKNGDLSALMMSKTLSKVGFYPNKKHYSHTQDEINKLLNQDRK